MAIGCLRRDDWRRSVFYNDQLRTLGRITAFISCAISARDCFRTGLVVRNIANMNDHYRSRTLIRGCYQGNIRCRHLINTLNSRIRRADNCRSNRIDHRNVLYIHRLMSTIIFQDPGALDNFFASTFTRDNLVAIGCIQAFRAVVKFIFNIASDQCICIITTISVHVNGFVCRNGESWIIRINSPHDRVRFATHRIRTELVNRNGIASDCQNITGFDIIPITVFYRRRSIGPPVCSIVKTIFNLKSGNQVWWSDYDWAATGINNRIRCCGEYNKTGRTTTISGCGRVGSHKTTWIRRGKHSCIHVNCTTTCHTPFSTIRCP